MVESPGRRPVAVALDAPDAEIELLAIRRAVAVDAPVPAPDTDALFVAISAALALTVPAPDVDPAAALNDVTDTSATVAVPDTDA